ncbi:glycosyltransferase family 4 protein [Zhihengliuella somnathii]
MKRRVLFVDHSSELGGGQLGLLRYLRRDSQFERSVLVLGDGEFAQQVRDIGIPIRVLPAADTYRSKLAISPRVKAEIDAISPDIVVTNSLPAANVVGIFSDSKRVRLAYLREELSQASLPRGLKRWAMFRRTLATFDGFLSNSNYTSSTLPQHLRQRACEVAYPVSGTEVRTASMLPTGPLTIASLSRLDRVKGLHVLLDAVAILRAQGRDVRALVAGGSAHADPSYADRLKRRVADEKLPVELLGHVDNVQRVIDDSHVLALCTLGPEPFGQVMIQAMASGRAVVATAMGGPVEVLEPSGAGILIPPGDANALATVIARLDDRRGELAELGRRGQKEAARFADDVTAPGLDDAIARLAGMVVPRA